MFILAHNGYCNALGTTQPESASHQRLPPTASGHYGRRAHHFGLLASPPIPTIPPPSFAVRRQNAHHPSTLTEASYHQQVQQEQIRYLFLLYKKGKTVTDKKKGSTAFFVQVEQFNMGRVGQKHSRMTTACHHYSRRHSQRHGNYSSLDDTRNTDTS